MSKMDRVVVTELVRSFVLCLFIYLAAGSCAGRARSRLALMPDDMIGRSGWSGPRSVILVTRRLIPEVGPSFFRASPQSIRMVDGSSLEQPIAS